MRKRWVLAAVCSPFLFAACFDAEPDPDVALEDETAEIVRHDPVPGQLAAGTAHACVIMADGTVGCWGAGTDGQLGDGAGVDRVAPVTAPLPARALALAAGDAHTCAVLVTGQVACWGDSSAGQTGTTTDLLAPAIVPNLGRVTALAAGSLHTCALHSEGAVSCWGANDRGQLGDGTGVDSVVPRFVRDATAPLADVRAITAGGDRACAIGAYSTPHCWGDNTPDQNGPDAPGSHYLVATYLDYNAPSMATTGDTTCRTSYWGSEYRCAGVFAVPESEASGVIVQLDTSDRFLCYTASHGRVVCQGANDRGQLGKGNTLPSESAHLLALYQITAIAVGDDFACAIDVAGTVRCWGRGERGQIGDGDPGTHDRPSPTVVAGGAAGGSRDLDVGGIGTGIHACAAAAGAVKCVGANASGQLGNDSTIPSMTPVSALGLSTITALTTGSSHTCAALAHGVVRCWGSNSAGQLGDGTTTSRDRPTTISDSTLFTDVAAGERFTCGADYIGHVWCWGINSSGQLGVPPSTLSRSLRPRWVEAITEGVGNIVKVDAGGGHACALDRLSWLWCWGRNTYGQSSANGTSSSYREPRNVVGHVRDFAVGANHTCIALIDGTVRCWGRNAAGQLGDGTQVDRKTPVTPKINQVVKIVAGSDHTCALRADGTARCWGGNTYGQLGVGDNTLRTQPAIVSLGGARLLTIAGGDVGTCGLRDDGAILCWGVIGQGTAPPSLVANVPTVIPGF